MSATIGNLPEIGEFLQAKIYTRDFRPVELKEYLKCGDDLMEISANAPSATEAYKFTRKLEFGVS
jgi:POLQ-like helicase